MNSDKLYKVQEQDLDRLKEILTVCFQNDPLYSTLIEDEATKERLLPHLLECDVTELFETCEVFADSPELKGVLILSDESDHRHAFYNYFERKPHHRRLAAPRGSDYEDIFQLCPRKRLPQLCLDRPAS